MERSARESVIVPEHAVIVHVAALPDDIGLDVIEDALIEAIDAAGVGEFDGNVIGPEDAELYMYGPNADALWTVIEPVVRAAQLSNASYAVKRYGEPGSPEERITL